MSTRGACCVYAALHATATANFCTTVENANLPAVRNKLVATEANSYRTYRVEVAVRMNGGLGNAHRHVDG